VNFEKVLNFLTDWALTAGLKILISVILLVVLFRIITKLTRRAEKKLLNSKKHMDKTLVSTVAYLVRIVLKLAVAVCIVGYLGVDTGGITALIASLGVGIGLAVNGALSNLAGGALLLLTRPFKIDDYIEAQSYSGTVEDIHIVNTRLRTPDNKVVYIPNGVLSAGTIVNYSEKDIRRIEFLHRTPLNADFEKVREILFGVADSESRILRTPEQSLVISETTETALIVSHRVWVENSDYWSVFFDITEKSRGALISSGFTPPTRQIEVKREKQ
jgi:small conductance mechanosensitive channel